MAKEKHLLTSSFKQEIVFKYLLCKVPKLSSFKSRGYPDLSQCTESKRNCKEHMCTTHRHQQQHRNWLGVGREWGWVRWGKAEKVGTTVSA